jgi:hypothetical protein
MFDQGTRAASNDEEFIRVVDTSGELMGQFPSSRIAREFARRMIEAQKASTLIVEWSKHGRRGQLAITRKTVDAADRRLRELKHQNERRARRWANLISAIAVTTIGLLALLNVASAYMEARQVSKGPPIVQSRTGG